jgi:hypothetical protein
MNQRGFANLIIIVAVIVVFSAIGFTYLVLNKGVKQPVARACTMEAKQCPDGSYVGRTGPACEFTACPEATTQSTEVEVINNFLAQWNVLQKSIPISPVLGSTTWQVDYLQFIGNNKLLIAFEDGHIMSAAVFGYGADNNFNYINTFKDDYPFTSAKWQEIVKTYGSEQYEVATYVKQITRGTEVVNFNDWTKVSENVFLKQGEELSTSSTSLTAGWKTYRNEQYGFELQYPSKWLILNGAKGTIVRVAEFDMQQAETSMPVNTIDISQYSPLINGSETLFAGKKAKVGEWEEPGLDSRFIKFINIVEQPYLSVFLEADNIESKELLNKILSTFKFISSNSSNIVIANILDNELTRLVQSTDLVNKYFIEFDKAKTYTIWLYVKEKPTNAQIENFVGIIATKLTNQLSGYFFNFDIFPLNSTKTPGDSQPYDSYQNVSWRNGQVIFPLND